MNEWFDIPGFEGAYQITKDGLVRSILRKEPKVLKPEKRHKGNIGTKGSKLLIYYLTKDGRLCNISLQKLLARTFIGEPPPDKQFAVVIDKSKPVTADNVMWHVSTYYYDVNTIRRCSKGHPLTEGNYYQDLFKKIGELRCIVCHREMVRQQYHRNKAKKRKDSKIF